ncbi:hypothetical protein JIR001_31190 [Polycladomyces abyssicola]|uniref:Uncharacterized protein n=1 Tax=Polycladomyces abyssicola TaxID=1125966 RepID=A0A8D5UGV0_9BACL|nr:hypothetical protein JIR001_31190 [Polycladomyces abyssicola]
MTILRKQLKPEKIPGPDPAEGMIDDSSTDNGQQDGSLGGGTNSNDQSGGSDY